MDTCTCSGAGIHVCPYKIQATYGKFSPHGGVGMAALIQHCTCTCVLHVHVDLPFVFIRFVSELPLTLEKGENTADFLHSTRGLLASIGSGGLILSRHPANISGLHQ